MPKHYFMESLSCVLNIFRVINTCRLRNVYSQYPNELQRSLLKAMYFYHVKSTMGSTVITPSKILSLNPYIYIFQINSLLQFQVNTFLEEMKVSSVVPIGT